MYVEVIKDQIVVAQAHLRPGQDLVLGSSPVASLMVDDAEGLLPEHLKLRCLAHNECWLALHKHAPAALLTTAPGAWRERRVFLPVALTIGNLQIELKAQLSRAKAASRRWLKIGLALVTLAGGYLVIRQDSTAAFARTPLMQAPIAELLNPDTTATTPALCERRSSRQRRYTQTHIAQANQAWELHRADMAQGIVSLQLLRQAEQCARAAQDEPQHAELTRKLDQRRGEMREGLLDLDRRLRTAIRQGDTKEILRLHAASVGLYPPQSGYASQLFQIVEAVKASQQRAAEEKKNAWLKF